MLRRHLTPYPTPLHDAALVEHGPYRLVRHPIYGGIVLGAAGVSADGNWLGLALVAALGALFWGKSGFEEGRLLAHFPGYADYRDRVRRRLIPGALVGGHCSLRRPGAKGGDLFGTGHR